MKKESRIWSFSSYFQSISCLLSLNPPNNPLSQKSLISFNLLKPFFKNQRNHNFLASFYLNTFLIILFSCLCICVNGNNIITNSGPIESDFSSLIQVNSRILQLSAPVIPDTLIPTNTLNDQSQSSITCLNDGTFVVSWQSDAIDGDLVSISAQQFYPNGKKKGTEFQVNTWTTDAQSCPRIASLNDGGFVIVWQSMYQDLSYLGIYAQRYNSDGTTYNGEFRVNTNTIGVQTLGSVASISDGGFVIAWQDSLIDGSSYGIVGKRYNGAGVSSTAQFQVNTLTAGEQSWVKVAGLNNGDYVITWQSNTQDGDGFGIFSRHYTSINGVLYPDFQVNTETISHQMNPDIASLNDGGYVITWQSNMQDGDGYGIFARRFNSDGSTNGPEIPINPSIAGSQEWPAITSLRDGGFIIVWQSDGQDGDGNGIYAIRFKYDGTPGAEFRVNDETKQAQTRPDVVSLNDGGFVITWTSFLQDGSGLGIFAQRYNRKNINVPMENTECYPFNTFCDQTPYQLYDNYTHEVFDTSLYEKFPIGLLTDVINNNNQNYTNIVTYYENLLISLYSLGITNITKLEEKGLYITAAFLDFIEKDEIVNSLENSLHQFGFDAAVLGGTFLLIGLYIASQYELMDIMGNFYNWETGACTGSVKDYYNIFSTIMSFYWIAYPGYLYLDAVSNEFASDYKNLFDQYSQLILFVFFFKIVYNKRWYPLKHLMESNISSKALLIERERNTIIDLFMIFIISIIQVILPSNIQYPFAKNLIANFTFYFASCSFFKSVLLRLANITIELLSFFYNTDRIHYIQRSQKRDKFNNYYLTDQQLAQKLKEDAKKTLLYPLKLFWDFKTKFYFISTDTTSKTFGSPITYTIQRSKKLHNSYSIQSNESLEIDNPVTRLMKRKVLRSHLNLQSQNNVTVINPYFYIDEEKGEISLKNLNNGDLISWQNPSASNILFDSIKEELLMVKEELEEKKLEMNVYEMFKNNGKFLDRKIIASKKDNVKSSTIKNPNTLLIIKDFLWNQAQRLEKPKRKIPKTGSLRQEIEVILQMDKKHIVPLPSLFQVHFSSLKKYVASCFKPCFSSLKLNREDEVVNELCFLKAKLHANIV